MKPIRLTAEDAKEVDHKLGVMLESEELMADYNLTPEQGRELYASIPKSGGMFDIPSFALDAVRGEMQDHAAVLRDMAADARSEAQHGQALRISKQAKRLEAIFEEGC